MSCQGCCKNSLSNAGLVLSQEKELPITDFTLKISDYLFNLIPFQNIAFFLKVSFSVVRTLGVQTVHKPVLIPCMSLCVCRQQGLCVKVRSLQLCSGVLHLAQLGYAVLQKVCNPLFKPVGSVRLFLQAL